MVGRNKRNSFNAIKEKFSKKLVSWKEKLLFKAGKEVLIKAVAQAIPTYTMGCFKIPESLCGDMISMIWNFWWGQKGMRGKWHGLVGKNCVRPRKRLVWVFVN